MARCQELFDAVAAGRKKLVMDIVTRELAAGAKPASLLDESMIPAMQQVGEKFSRGESFVPEMLVAARAMQAGIAILEPHLVGSGRKPVGKVAIGTVKGDLHDIGKNLVVIMLRSAGFEVIDLGSDCELQKYRDAVIKDGAQAILASALLTTTMPYMKTIVEGFADMPNVPIIIGGAPITEGYMREIGAHGTAKDAAAAVTVTRQLLCA